MWERFFIDICSWTTTVPIKSSISDSIFWNNLNSFGKQHCINHVLGFIKAACSPCFIAGLCLIPDFMFNISMGVPILYLAKINPSDWRQKSSNFPQFPNNTIFKIILLPNAASTSGWRGMLGCFYSRLDLFHLWGDFFSPVLNSLMYV